MTSELDIRLIAAVGRQGQLGMIDGALPWHDAEDLKFFREMTTGGIVVMGHNTLETIPAAAKVSAQRAFVEVPRSLLQEPNGGLCRDWLELVASTHGGNGRIIWIAGGARTYRAFMPFVRRSIITHIDYTGRADVFMPSLWQNAQ